MDHELLTDLGRRGFLVHGYQVDHDGPLVSLAAFPAPKPGGQGNGAVTIHVVGEGVGVQGFPVMAARIASKALMSFLRAVET